MAEIIHLGIGLYTLPEAARLIGVRTSRLSRWVTGYSFRAGTSIKFSDPVLTHVYPELIARRVITFADLIELYVIRLFIAEGVSLQTIRAAAQTLSTVYPTPYPFASQRIHTDGKRLFIEMEGGKLGLLPRRVRSEIPVIQLVFESIASEFFKKLEYEQDVSRRYWPLGTSRSVVLDPARSFGKPIDSESGVPTRVLADLHKAGERLEDVAELYRVSVESVKSAVEYEQSLTRAA